MNPPKKHALQKLLNSHSCAIYLPIYSSCHVLRKELAPASTILKICKLSCKVTQKITRGRSCANLKLITQSSTDLTDQKARNALPSDNVQRHVPTRVMILRMRGRYRDEEAHALGHNHPDWIACISSHTRRKRTGEPDSGNSGSL